MLGCKQPKNLGGVNIGDNECVWIFNTLYDYYVCHAYGEWDILSSLEKEINDNYR